MCGRFSTADLAKTTLADYFGLLRVAPYETRYNIAPGAPVPAIRATEKGRVLDLLHWGLIPAWAKDREIARHTFNARLETLAEKPSFRQAVRQRRCIVPASGFYEWQQLGAQKQPYYIHRADGAPLALAGLWERWLDPVEGEIESCSIVTMPAVAPMTSIHHRMPAVLEPEHFSLWLDPQIHEPHLLEDVLKAEAHRLALYPVSPFVSNARHEGAQCIEPLQ